MPSTQESERVRVERERVPERACKRVRVLVRAERERVPESGEYCECARG